MFGKTIAEAQAKVRQDLDLSMARHDARTNQEIADIWQTRAAEYKEWGEAEHRNFFNSEVFAAGAVAVVKDIDRMLNEIKIDQNKLQVYREALFTGDRPDRALTKNVFRRRILVAAARARAVEIAASASAMQTKSIDDHVQAIERQLLEAGLINVLGGEAI